MTPVIVIGSIAILSLVGFAIAKSSIEAAGVDMGNVIDMENTPAAPVDSGLLLGDGMNVAAIDAMNRDTWPQGDAVWRFCQAVAFAEGYGADPSNAPTSHRNPGDLGPGDTGYPGESHGGSIVSLMPDDATGWSALYTKWARIFAGNSSAYPNTLTIVQAAQKYAGDWSNWAKNVSSDLGVAQSTRLIDWYRAQ